MRLLRAHAFRVLVVAATVALGCTMLAWTLLSPAFRAPDEHVHFTSVIRLEHGGGWPEPGDALVPPGVDTAIDESYFMYKLPRSETHWGNPPRWFHLVTPETSFTVIDESNALPDSTSSRTDQMTQHPPLFYALQAGLAHAAGMPGETWPVQLLFARLVDVCLMLPVPALIASSARRFGLSGVSSGAAAFLPLALPQVSHISASVTSDALVTLLAAVWAWTMVKVWGEGMSYRGSLLIGIALGAAIATKGTALVAIPVTLAFAVAAAPRRGLKVALARGAISMTSAFAVGGWWYGLRWVREGSPIPPGLSLAATESYDPERSVAGYVSRASTMFVDSFVGRFSYLELTFSTTYSRAIVLGIIVASAWAVVARWRDSTVLWSLFPVPVLFVLVTLVNNYDWYASYGLMPGFQGRYLFIGLAGMGLALAIAFDSMNPRWRAAIASLAIASAGIVSLLAFRFAMKGFYQGRDEVFAEVWSRWDMWSLGGTAGVVTAMVALVMASMSVAVGAVTAGASMTRLPSQSTRQL